MVDHIQHVKTIINHLGNIEETFTNKDIIIILLSSSPQPYENFVTSFMMIGKLSFVTLNNLEGMLL